jgi:ethanolamine utilization protein EutA
MSHGHGHGDDHDRLHDHFEIDIPDEQHPLWLTDHVQLTTVGIDIGSATVQVVFAELELRRRGRELTSRYGVVDRRVLYRSPIRLTEYTATDQIDQACVADALRDSFAAVGLRPDQVDSGAVLLTGEALRRRNARAIAELLAELGGDFVCVAAGHHMEAELAANGSGAVALSARVGGVLNVDVGGGTTKFTLVRDGRIVRTAALHVGGRLVALDAHGTAVRVEPAASRLARDCGATLVPGEPVAPGELTRLAEYGAGVVDAAVLGKPVPDGLWLTEPLGDVGDLAAIVMSGGVAEHFHDPGLAGHGDLGVPLGAALRDRASGWPAEIAESVARIRATVLGASQFTVQLSGNTIYVSDPDALPVRNRQVVSVPLAGVPLADSGPVERLVRDRVAAAELVDGEDDFVLAVRWDGPPSFQRIASFARGVGAAMPRTAAERTLCVVLDEDVARLVGTLLHDELAVAASVVCADGVELRDFDFVDVGRVLKPSNTVQITIKSLVFGAAQDWSTP